MAVYKVTVDVRGTEEYWVEAGSEIEAIGIVKNGDEIIDKGQELEFIDYTFEAFIEEQEEI